MEIESDLFIEEESILGSSAIAWSGYPGLYEQELLFQQDNAPVHSARLTQEWFRSKNIEVLEWPPQSPDLNLIENVWGRLKYELRGRKFETQDDLWDEIERLWHQVPLEFVRSLYNSIERRISAVIKSKGSYTTY